MKEEKKSYATKSIPVINPYAAGVDIGATEIYIAVPNDQDSESVRVFGTFTEDLKNIVIWLRKCQIKTVAMESTGVYWIPLFQLLEKEGFEVCLVNAHHIKNVPGKKTDVIDCQWIQYLHAVGLLRASFRPCAEICAIRSILRHKERLVQMAASHVQHIQKALTQMNLQLHNVISDITGVTGLSILDAILAGERDPQVLAKLRDKRIKASEAIVAKSLEGDYYEEHLFTLEQALKLYRDYQQLILSCDVKIMEMLKDIDKTDQSQNKQEENITDNRKEELLNLRLNRAFGVDLTTIPGVGPNVIQTLLAEIGNNLVSFPTAQHFSSWIGVCPDNRISGGRVLSTKTRKVKNRVANALRIAALSAGRSYTAVGDYYRRIKSRIGGPKAITATAHKLARIIFAVIKSGKPYDETEFQNNELRYQEKLKQRIQKQALALGLKLTPINNIA